MLLRDSHHITRIWLVSSETCGRLTKKSLNTLAYNKITEANLNNTKLGQKDKRFLFKFGNKTQTSSGSQIRYIK